MRLILSDDSIVLCENKLDAAETIGNVESGNLLQLERYLQLPVDHVIYIRSELLPPSYQVMSHPKYLSPIERPHYLWRDIYPLLCEDPNPIVGELRDGFKSMGFVPAHPVIGDLTRNAPRAQRENLNFDADNDCGHSTRLEGSNWRCSRTILLPRNSRTCAGSVRKSNKPYTISDSLHTANISM